jgi:hypothetical protein
MICEVIGERQIANDILSRLGSMLPNAEEAIIDPKTIEEQSTTQTFEPVSDFGEKRVLPITNKTVVLVKKME